MFLIHGNRLIDADLEFLTELLEILDSQLDRLDAEVPECPDPDGFGIYDRMEAVAGIGFVACQQYMTGTYTQLRLAKTVALDFGPRHCSGQSITHAINAAANYWKHREEWDLDRNKNQKNRTVAILKALGISVERDYVLPSMLAVLVNPTRFFGLVAPLEAWRDDMLERAASQIT